MTVLAGVLDWHAIDWRAGEDHVRRRRQRIITASQAQDHKRVRNLQKLMLRSPHRPDSRGPLATFRLVSRIAADPTATRLLEQLPVRHTDRRTLGDEPVAAEVLESLIAAAEEVGVRLHIFTGDQRIDLAVLIERAQQTENADERRRNETASWVGGDRTGGAGIPDANLPATVPQTMVAQRDFGTLSPGSGHDNAASYAVLYGTGDEPIDWLRAGEALSAVWLTAAADPAPAR